MQSSILLWGGGSLFSITAPSVPPFIILCIRPRVRSSYFNVENLARPGRFAARAYRALTTELPVVWMTRQEAALRHGTRKSAEESDDRFGMAAASHNSGGGKGAVWEHTCSRAATVVGPKRFGLAVPVSPRRAATPWRLPPRGHPTTAALTHRGGALDEIVFNNGANDGDDDDDDSNNYT